MRSIVLRTVLLRFFVLVVFLHFLPAKAGRADRRHSWGTAAPMAIVGERVMTDGFVIPITRSPETRHQQTTSTGLLSLSSADQRAGSCDPAACAWGSAGANNYDYMARELIRMSGGTIEVWATERRPNLFEDLTGMNGAERARDPQFAVDYYYHGKEVDGRSFQGFLTQDDVAYLSEWA